MTYVVALSVYYCLYLFLYGLPTTLVLFLFARAAKIIPALAGPAAIVALVALAAILIIPGYRAGLAARAYGERDMGFWEAHTASGVVLRVQLSYLPLVGPWFRKKSP